jgi:hypothetical protein
MKKIVKMFGILFAYILTLIYSSAQIRPDPVGRNLPDPSPDRIEVRFAYNKKTVSCEQFHLVAKFEDRILLEGDFTNGFNIPPEAKNLSKTNTIELELQCGKYRWHFIKLRESTFNSGYWWIGTDYPPFHNLYFHNKYFKDTLWISTLEVDPSEGESGFTVWKKCSKKLMKKKSSSCYD